MTALGRLRLASDQANPHGVSYLSLTTRRCRLGMFAIGPAFAAAMDQKDDRMTHTAANTASGVGASLLRKEDARHLRGRGQFVSDVQLPRMQDVAFVRSPHAHARIKGIAVAPNASG